MTQAKHQQGLIVENLSAGYGAVPALDGVSFHVQSSAVTALLGPNGSGKSTALKAIAGLMDYTGDAWLDGNSLGAMTPQERAQKIAYVPQRTKLEAPLPVEAVVGHGRFVPHKDRSDSGTSDRDAIEAALSAAGIQSLRKRPFTSLSGGERQRVLLARALATGASTLLLDEPTSAQDVAHGLLMAETLRELAAQGVTVLVVLHDLRQVRELADQAVLLSDGRVRCTGSARGVTGDGPVREVFGVRVIESAGLGLALDAPAKGAAPEPVQ